MSLVNGDDLKADMAKAFQEAMAKNELDDLSNSIYTNDQTGNIAAIPFPNDNSFTFSNNEPPAPAIELTGEGDVKIGDLRMPIAHLEICMKTLLEISKEKYPEDFI